MKRVDMIMAEASIRQAEGNLAAAQGLLETALNLVADRVDILNQLAMLRAQQGDHRGALELYQRITALRPGDTNAVLLLGVEYAETADYISALNCFQTCLAANPDSAGLHQMIGVALRELGRADEAIHHFEQALRINPGDLVAATHLAIQLIEKLRMGEAEALLRRVLDTDPDNALALNNLGRVFKFQGCADIAISCFRRALELEPKNPVLVDNLLFSLNYLSDVSPHEVQAEHLRLCAQIYPAADQPLCPVESRPSGKLKLGYVSGDFHNHSVSFFLEPILQNHDHEHFEIYCYANDTRVDDTTRRLQALADQWRLIAGLSDEQAAEMVRDDGINVLIDLAGHTSENRLGLFALKPAPVQASWLGYPHSSGLKQIDYYLTDALCDPPGISEPFYCERLIRLPRVFCCYMAPPKSPEVVPPPFVTSGVVTFGSFNNFAKVNDRLIAIWSSLLQRVPNSRLLLKSMALGDAATQERVLASFASHGIASDRIALLNTVKSAFDHLALYNQIDIALDTFPYHGTTTTCEALWMGVPLVTLTGCSHASRVGHSLLASVGLSDLVAATPEEYLAKAVALADDTARLWQLRLNLRSIMARSALMDAPGVTKDLEFILLSIAGHTVVDSLETAHESEKPEDLENLYLEAETEFAHGRFKEAEAIFLSLLARFPLNAGLQNSLGTVLDRLGRHNEAAARYNKAIFLDKTLTVARFNLANSLKRLGDTSACLLNLQAVVNEVPAFADAWQNLAVCHEESGRLEDAIDCLKRVAELEPGRTGCWAELGELYYRLGEHLDQALDCFEKVLERLPDNATVINSKGLVLHELGDYEGAEAAFQKAISIAGVDSKILNNLGLTFLARSRPAQARSCFEQALVLEPDEPSVMFNRGMARLMTGDFDGWDDYEQRFNKTDPVSVAEIGLPRWSGEPLLGKTLLVRAEQGYGDCIQFIRYVPLLARGGNILVECLDRQIEPLFRSLSGVCGTVIRGEGVKADFQVPLGSLPLLFRANADSIPFAEGYLRPDPERLAQWQQQLLSGVVDKKLKVGLVWGGRRTRLNANRSIPLVQLAPLLKTPGIRWFSIQTGTDATDLAALGDSIEDLGSRFRDFADSAAAIVALDLVISIDTAAAHLAGALGKPVWVLLKQGADWRWLLEREDSPWYSSARLFRQQKSGEWGAVVASVQKALKNFSISQNNL